MCSLYPAVFGSVMVQKSSEDPVPVLCCSLTLQWWVVFSLCVCVCVCLCVCVCSLFYTLTGEICKEKARSDSLLQRRLKLNG